jgi:hypothetical protein
VAAVTAKRLSSRASSTGVGATKASPSAEMRAGPPPGVVGAPGASSSWCGGDVLLCRRIGLLHHREVEVASTAAIWRSGPPGSGRWWRSGVREMGRVRV